MNNKKTTTKRPGAEGLGRIHLIICLLLFLIPSAFAQSGQSNSNEFKTNAPCIFIDCQVYDIGFLREEIKQRLID